MLYKDSLNKVKIPCYLCMNHYDRIDQKHRDMCAFNHKEELEAMPSPRKVWCCLCSEKLKLWPAYKMTPFRYNLCEYCNVDTILIVRCKSGFERCPLKGKSVRCDGSNRYILFWYKNQFMA